MRKSTEGEQAAVSIQLKPIVGGGRVLARKDRNRRQIAESEMLIPFYLQQLSFSSPVDKIDFLFFFHQADVGY
jgi:hypothetical protein